MVLKVKVPRWRNDHGEEFEQSPLCPALYESHRALARLIVDVARFMTLSDVAVAGRERDTVKTVVQRRWKTNIERLVTGICGTRVIDESMQDAQIRDADHRSRIAAITWTGDGKGGDALREFWRRFKQSGGGCAPWPRRHERRLRGERCASMPTPCSPSTVSPRREALMNERLDDSAPRTGAGGADTKQTIGPALAPAATQGQLGTRRRTAPGAKSS